MKKLLKNIFYNIDIFHKFYLNQINITIKKKNLIQEEASKFSNILKFYINSLQLERNLIIN